MEGGSTNQGENHDENTNHDANNSGQSTQTQSSGTITSFDIAAFTVTFPPGPEPDELVSDNGEDDEGHEAKPSVCCLCFKCDRKLYTIPPQNKASFQELLKNVVNSDGDYGVVVPERVCWDCNEILTSMTAFRTRAIQTNSLLYSLIRPFINQPLDACTGITVGDLTILQTRTIQAGLADYHFVCCSDHEINPSHKDKKNKLHEIQQINLLNIDLIDDDTLIFNDIDSSDDNIS